MSLVAEEAVETLLPLAERHGVAVACAGDVATAAGSRALLLQMATNLVHNAVVHNLPRDGAVRVTTGARDGTVTLTAENTGAPVPPELVATLAEPFQRGAGRVRSDHAGVGLGLAIVQSIVQAHDGRLAIAARDGGGLRVTVALPARPVADRR